MKRILIYDGSFFCAFWIAFGFGIACKVYLARFIIGFVNGFIKSVRWEER